MTNDKFELDKYAPKYFSARSKLIKREFWLRMKRVLRLKGAQQRVFWIKKIISHFLPVHSRNIKKSCRHKKTQCSCYYFMLRIWRGVHNVVSRTPLWLLRKLQLRASYSNSNPCGTYILADAGECTFQLSFREAHISLGRPSLAASAVLAAPAGDATEEPRKVIVM